MFPFLDGHAKLNPVEWKNSIWRVWLMFAFFALKTCGFLKIALNNSQTRRPKLTRRSSRLRPLLWFSPGKHAKGKDVRACFHGSELLCYFFGLFFCLIGGPPRRERWVLGPAINRACSIEHGEQPPCSARSCHGETKKRPIWVLPLVALSITPSRTDTLPDSPRLHVWQPFLWQFRPYERGFLLAL